MQSKTRILKLGILPMIILGLLGCNSNSGSSQSTNSLTGDKKKLTRRPALKAGLDSIRPGKGYSIYLGELSEDVCYNAVAHPVEAKGKVDFSTEFGAAAFSEKMAGEISLGANAPGPNPFISVSALAKYVKDQKDTTVSSSVYYTTVLNRTMSVSRNENNAFWTMAGQENYDAFLNGDITAEDFSALCGDYAIEKYRETAAVIIKLSFQFMTEEENQQFKAEFHQKSLFNNIDGKYEISADFTKYSGKVVISAVQFGGHPEQLSMITSSANGVLTCDIRNLYACEGIISSLLSYGGMFSSQFMREGGAYLEGINMLPNGGIVLGQPFYTRYKKLSVYKLPSGLSQLRNSIAQNIAKLKATQYILSKWLNYGGPFASTDSINNSYLSYFRNKLGTALEKLSSIDGEDPLANCWKSPAICQETYNKYKDLLNNVQSYLIKDSSQNWGMAFFALDDTTNPISPDNGKSQQLYFISMPPESSGKNIMQTVQPGKQAKGLRTALLQEGASIEDEVVETISYYTAMEYPYGAIPSFEIYNMYKYYEFFNEANATPNLASRKAGIR